MSFGIQTFNDGNILQIDESLQHHSVLQEGTMGTYSADGNYANTLYFPWVNAPIVMIAPPPGYYITLASPVTNNSVTLKAANADGEVVYAAVPYRIFASMADVHYYNGNNTHGLAIYDGAGTLKFNSNYRLFKVYSSLLLLGGAWNYGISPGAWGHVAGQWVAVNGLGMFGFLETGEPNLSFIYMSYVRSYDGNTIETGGHVFGYGPGQAYGADYYVGSYRILTSW